MNCNKQFSLKYLNLGFPIVRAVEVKGENGTERKLRLLTTQLQGENSLIQYLHTAVSGQTKVYIVYNFP